MRQDRQGPGLASGEGMADENRCLVERAREGDRDAVSGLFERYRLRVVRFCLSYAPVGEADAHDITQEVFIRALRGLRRLRRPERFESWLFSIARRRCLTHIKRVRQRRDDMRRLAQETVTEAPDDVEAERHRELERAIVGEEIARLPDSAMKEVGRMYYLEGRDTTFIAEQMDAPQSTVTTWLSRFRGRIRKRLVLRILELRGQGVEEAP